MVNVSESASGSSPLVDAAANHTSTASAESGNDNSTATSFETTDASQKPSSLATNIDTLDGKVADAGHAAAEPSAGDAAAESNKVPAIAQPINTEELHKANQNLQTVNGLHDNASQGSVTEDGGSHDASAVNSDTDMSKGDASELKDGHLHMRTNSVKKPTTFSKISVTKNFLAKSASAAPAAAKTSERGTNSISALTGITDSIVASPVNPAPAPAAKPRLIAKTGASIRELQKARQNAESPSGPDASKVWNKNRPTAPPPPKQFTDEELKQQYGIHLATRLQSDENGKESKWADIDEDEDDWVPEAVTWIDGTKSALTPADNAPPTKDAKPVEPAAEKPAEGAKPSLTALKRPTEPSGPPKTILKPGAAAQAKQNGLATQSPGSEKATLKAKSPAPPAKSPWATLPPVDKVSPITPPVQQVAQPPSLATQDARAYDSSMPPPPPPAREIAADTFDRSWREGEGGSRELFNSVSGRREPAPEGRRSSRPDPYGRKPVLQRPPQPGMDHPPEPSPAFQTRSGSQTDGAPAWARRRGSSVSQGSMAPRRMSINRNADPYSPHERRPSTVTSHDMKTSPNLARAEMHGMFNQQNAWQQQLPPPPQAGVGEEMEDPVKVQERIMKEKRELARKRRQEEEEAAETARKERLKAKMAALEGAGQSRQERQAAKDAAAAAAPKPDTDVKVEATASVEPQGNEPAPPKEPQATTDSNVVPEAQTLPPSTNVSEPTRASMPQADLPSSMPKPENVALPARSISDHMQRQGPRGPLSPKANARAPFQQATSSPYRAPNSAFSSPGERKQQPFGRSPMVGNDGFSPWPSAGSGNVWGTAGIGNGVFESASSFAPMPMMSQQGSSLPPPPGMARPGTSTRISPQALGSESRSPSLQPNHVTEQTRAFAPPGMEGRPDHFMAQPRPSGASPGPGMGRHIPGPIAPPSRAQPPLHQQTSEDSRLNAWRSAAQSLPAQYEKAGQIGNQNVPENMSAPPADDTFKETFKQTSRGRLGGPRKVEKSEYTIHDAQGSRSVSSLTPAPPSTQTQPAVPLPTTSPMTHPWKQTAENTVRLPDGSMNPAHGGAPVQPLPIGRPQGRPQPAPVGTPRRVNIPTEPLPPTVDSKEQPPPPPETATHPVYTGNAKHPHVRLPRSKPVVKLPPQPVAAPSQQPSVVMPPRQHWGPPGAMRPLVQNEAWQARFNGLFNRTNITTETPPSPPKTPPKTQSPAYTVASSSRTAMHEAPAAPGATVSLPQGLRTNKRATVEGFLIDDSSDIVSKDTIEQMFNEELSFGSKPLTRIPRNAVYPDLGLDPKYNMLAMRAEDVAQPSEALSKVQFDMLKVHYRNPKGCFVKMPGVKTKHNPIFWRRSGPYKGPNKPKAKVTNGKDSQASTQASTAQISTAPKKNGSQKPSAASTPQQKSPAPATTENPASGGSKRGGKVQKGRAQTSSVKST